MQFDPLDPTFRLDPYPTYALLREQAPIYFWAPWSLWFISPYAECNALLRDSRLGRTDRRIAAPPKYESAFDIMRSKWMLLLDPPDHTRLHGLVHKAFTPRMVAQMRERVETIAGELLDRVQDRGRMDIMADFAYPLPVAVICALLGIPVADHRYFHGWSAAIARASDLIDTKEVYDQASVAVTELTAYLDELLTERKRRPQNDLFSALAIVEEASERLSREELFANCLLLLFAGHETTVNLIGNGTLALLNQRTQWDRLVSNPNLADSAVEELLRYDSPLQITTRRVQEEFSYQGHTFPLGHQIVFLIGSANRDAAQFMEPDRLDIRRNSKSHLAFGGGIHYCLGAPLARMEGSIAFATLARRFPKLALCNEPIQYRNNFSLRGLEKLMVTF